MSMQKNFRPVVEAGSSYSSVIETEPGGANNVKWNGGSRTEASNVSGIRRDLRFYESYMNHRLNCKPTSDVELKYKRNDEIHLKS